MQISDSLTLDASGLKLTRDGYLIGDAKVARAGNVQQYAGSELGLTGDDANKWFGVYRDPDAVFDSDSMMSLAGRPVTRGHPMDGVNASNWKDLAIGQVGGVIRRDGEHVVAPMAIMDATAAKEVSEGARSLSAGYTCTLIADEGVATDGTPYQFKQTGPIRFNHVAYLPDNNPRAGNTRIGDRSSARQTQQQKDADPMTKSVTIDGKTFEVTDEVAAAIAKVQADKDAALATAKDAGTIVDQAKSLLADLVAQKAVSDKAVADAKAEAEEAKKAVNADAIHAAAADLASVIDAAKAIAPNLDVKGKGVADIKRAAVVAKLGDEKAKDKSAAYIDGMFDLLASATNDADPVAAAIKSGVSTGDAGSKARASYLDNLSTAWKQ